MTAPSTAHLLRTGIMECAQTWLPREPGQNITDRSDTAERAVRTTCSPYAVFTEHPEGRILTDTGVPQDRGTRSREFFPVPQGTSRRREKP